MPADPAEPRPVFQVLVLYQDYACGRRTNETCSLLLSHLGDEFELSCRMWKFEMLRNPELAEAAAAEALGANVVIVAAHESSPLPVEFTRWIDSWLPLRGKETAALIALIDGSVRPTASLPSVYGYLQEVAGAAGMDFLPNVTTLAEERLSSSYILQSEINNAQLDELTNGPAPERHWGINE